MALPFNLNTTTTTRTQGEKVEYIEPGAHQCKITGLTTSDSLENYNGSPFIQYTVKNTSGKVVPTGMQLYDIESDGRRLQGKMLILK